MTFLSRNKQNTPRDTQAIFHFMGPLKTLAQDLSLESQAPHALTSQMFCKREKMFIFILLSLFVFAYFRNKDFQHFV